jgi:hypothetical protein
MTADTIIFGIRVLICSLLLFVMLFWFLLLPECQAHSRLTAEKSQIQMRRCRWINRPTLRAKVARAVPIAQKRQIHPLIRGFSKKIPPSRPKMLLTRKITKRLS